VNNPRESH